MTLETDTLEETAVQPALNTVWMGRPYRYFSQVGSTNDLLKEAEAPAHGAVYLTDYQSEGRGRLNRRWLAPPGSSLLLSVFLRPNWPAQWAQWLMMIGSLAVAAAVEAHTAVAAGVKWPNDVVIRQAKAWAKASGLLLEGSFDENGRLRSAILGMGINVNIPPHRIPEAEMPATSLLAATGSLVPRLPLLVMLLAELERLYEAAEAGESPQPAWNRRLVWRDRAVVVTGGTGERPLRGTVKGVDSWGRLLLRDKTGEIRTIAAGDVTLRPG